MLLHFFVKEMLITQSAKICSTLRIAPEYPKIITQIKQHTSNPARPPRTNNRNRKNQEPWKKNTTQKQRRKLLPSKTRPVTLPGSPVATGPQTPRATIHQMTARSKKRKQTSPTTTPIKKKTNNNHKALSGVQYNSSKNLHQKNSHQSCPTE